MRKSTDNDHELLNLAETPERWVLVSVKLETVGELLFRGSDGVSNMPQNTSLYNKGPCN